MSGRSASGMKGLVTGTRIVHRPALGAASAIVVEVREAYMHCPKAFMRSKLWDPAAQIDRKTFPSLVCMIGDQVGLAQPSREAAEERSARAYRDGLWEPIK